MTACQVKASFAAPGSSCLIFFLCFLSLLTSFLWNRECFIFVLLSSLVHLAGPFHILSQLPRTLFYPHIPSLISPVTKLGNPKPFHHGTSPVQIFQHSAPELPTWIPSSQERPPTYLSPSMPWSNQLYADHIHNVFPHHLVISRGPPRPSCTTRLKPTAGLSTYGNAIFQVNSLLTIKL